jgi:hypothetical protein
MYDLHCQMTPCHAFGRRGADLIVRDPGFQENSAVQDLNVQGDFVGRDLNVERIRQERGLALYAGSVATGLPCNECFAPTRP